MMPLSQLLSTEVFGFMLVFVRLGTAAMILPGFGENFVFARVRLGLAVALTVVIYPLVSQVLPAPPVNPGSLLVLIFGEFLHGLFIGGAARLMMGALHTAGTVISFQSGLSYAQTLDPTQGTQGALLSAFLTLLGIVLIFTTGLHLQLIGALYDSYELFPPGEALPIEDVTEFVRRIVSGAFKVGIQIAAPFFVFGLAFYVGLGLLQKLIPQVQLFFVALPLQMTLAILLFAVALSGMMVWFLDYFGETIATLRVPV